MRRSDRKRHRAEQQRPPLSVEEAHVILEPYFLAARDLFTSFCEAKGLGDAVSRTRFECRTDVHDTERHFAGATTDGKLIVLAVEMPDLPEDTVAAIVAHEFGHIVDHLYPGQFQLIDEELVLLADPAGDARAEYVRSARYRQWSARDYHSVELAADRIAEQAIGSRIGYSGKCMLQGLNRGVPRPRNLR